MEAAMPFVDFAALKQRVAIDDVVPLLGLDLKLRGVQWRGPCPACRTGGERALVVTPEKSAFYCFGGKTGGDVIALVAHIRGCSMKEAADELARLSGQGSGGGRRDGDPDSSATVPEERKKEAARSLQPLAYLQSDHQAVLSLGLTGETCEAFGAGFAPKGIMRGRLAIPVHDQGGTLVAYCGQALAGESPALIFPNGFRPWELIFNAHRLTKTGQDGEGEIILARDPLEVMITWQNGIANAVSLLTEAIRPEQLEMLSGLMDRLKCEHLHIA
jgi:CHC2 zinc finger